MVKIKRLLTNRITRITVSIIIAMVVVLLIAFPAFAQVHEPTSTFVINNVEAYRNNFELNDQLYVITGTVKYGMSFPTMNISDTFIVRLMTALGAELGNTTFYPIEDNGYALGVTTIYFDSASAPVWNNPYEVHIQGNPTLHWLDTTAVSAMDGAMADDGGVFTDETAASNNVAANDMTLLPVLPVAGDAYYFGSDGMFDILTLNIGTQGDWTGTYTWEYWDGDEWKLVTALNDNTIGFTVGVGNYDVTYDCPTDWQTTVVNGLDLYWLRFRVVTFTAIVAQPLGTQSWTNTLDDPPAINTNVFNLWYDDGTLAGTSDALTTVIRGLAQDIEDDWGGTNNLIETVAGEDKLTPLGEQYFTNSFPNLRTLCPDLFRDVMTSLTYPAYGLVEDFYLEDDDTDYDIFGANLYAQTFTASAGYEMNGVELKMSRLGAPNNIEIALLATAAGLPIGADLATTTVSANAFTTNTEGNYYQFSFDTAYTVTSGTVYAIVAEVAAGNAANYVSWRIDTTGTYTGGQACSGPAWAAIPGEDFIFNVTATGAYTLSYRNRLANRLVGTPLDMTTLGASVGISRIWMSTIVFMSLSVIIAVAAAWGAHSYKVATLSMLMMMPIGGLVGFMYLEVALIAAFFCTLAVVYVFAYRGAP